MNLKIDIYSKDKEFGLKLGSKEIEYTIIYQTKEYGETIRKEESQYDKTLYYYKTQVTLQIKDFEGFSYKTIYVDETINTKGKKSQKLQSIENQYYCIFCDNKGVHLRLKEEERILENFIYLEESGDEGDNYDYSYPIEDTVNKDYFSNSCIQFEDFGVVQSATIKGQFQCPKDLDSRKKGIIDCVNDFILNVELKDDDKVIKINGSFNNKAKNHRVRLVVRTEIPSKLSHAGTQFGIIERETYPKIMDVWKQEEWLEEPSPIYPLLNHVSLKRDGMKHTVFTRSSKEYEIIGEEYTDIAVTLFRSVGYLGLPDLNRRPGRASGLAEKIIESPDSQMFFENGFEIGIMIHSKMNDNKLIFNYNEFSVDELYYQKQDFNRVVYPISYFHTNPLNFRIKDTYFFKNNQVSNELAFSTLEKIDDKYIIRLFNNETDFILNRSIKKYNMLGKEKEVSNEIKEGEIINMDIGGIQK